MNLQDEIRETEAKLNEMKNALQERRSPFDPACLRDELDSISKQFSELNSRLKRLEDFAYSLDCNLARQAGINQIIPF